MRIGCCLSPNTFMPEFKNSVHADQLFTVLTDGYKNILNMGFDFVEATSGSVNDLKENELQALAEMVKSGDFGIEYVNCFLPGHIRVCVNHKEARAHADKTFKNLHTVGIKALVFGSGGARSYPEGMTEAEGRKYYKDFLLYCADVGSQYGIFTCIEPLQKTETNQVNFVSQAIELAREFNHPYLRITPDAFHMAVGNEDPAVLKEALPYINHIHVSEAPGRLYPGFHGGEYLKKVGSVLHEIGYNSDLTIECGYTDFIADMSAGLAFLKENVV